MGTRETAEYLDVQPATIRDWISKGKDILLKKVGKAWKFKLSELGEWIASGKSAFKLRMEIFRGYGCEKIGIIRTPLRGLQ
ncbi:helix-turn-helix domain-containing protein [uncultured Anaerococcus sp.]|uniref:helix-turn-helix domain-containing protein n=1 Tax=uncultured Anaerococcus sp. TaxID=293428 RepID=UPI00288B2538|nr:helix-turn-helix domain-containing protein [uncultured Anaerococcus sp.]